MMKFRLTQRAQDDLLSIARYTQQHWGVSQRNQYLLSFDACFRHIAENPSCGRVRDDIRLGYRQLPQGSHVVFYHQISDGWIDVVRILHKSPLASGAQDT